MHVMPYSTTFAAGGLLREASVRVVVHARDVGLEGVQPEVLDVPSRAGRRRKTLEIVRRLSAAAPDVWEDLPERPPEEQAAILYYCCMKTYLLIRDLHFEVVLPAWRSLSASVGAHDVRRYLEKRSAAHPEIDAWSEGTRDKVQQVFRKMLAEVGLLRGEGTLQRVRLPAGFMSRFAAEGDVWFLEAMLLAKDEREEIARTEGGRA